MEFIMVLELMAAVALGFFPGYLGLMEEIDWRRWAALAALTLFTMARRRNGIRRYY
jgi:hypothetical protein